MAAVSLSCMACNSSDENESEYIDPARIEIEDLIGTAGDFTAEDVSEYLCGALWKIEIWEELEADGQHLRYWFNVYEPTDVVGYTVERWRFYSDGRFVPEQSDFDDEWSWKYDEDTRVLEMGYFSDEVYYKKEYRVQAISSSHLLIYYISDIDGRDSYYNKMFRAVEE